jgi:hypothetical protein
MSFMSKFGNLSVGCVQEEGRRDRYGGKGWKRLYGEGDDVFKSMDAECKVCIQKTR